MHANNDRGFQERLNSAAQAKKALLERAKAKLNADDPVTLERRAARDAAIKAREARIAEKEAVRQAAEAARLAEEATRKAEEERFAAELAALEAAEKAERDAREAELEAARKAERDARYAARKGRKTRDLSWLTGASASPDA